METVLILAAYFAALSVAVERIVEVSKSLVLKNVVNATGVNKNLYQAVAAIAGGLIAYITPIPGGIQINQELFAVISGFAVSGGAGFWNTVLDALKANTALKERNLS